MSNLKVRVAPSNIHGNGVFANCDIAKGTVMCFYDGHKEKIDINKLFNGHYYTAEYLTYSVDCNNSFMLFLGYKEPKCDNGIAQLVNDGDILNFSTIDVNDTNSHKGIYKSIMQEIQRYTTQSRNVANCMLDHKTFEMLATRDIKANEELFYHYGCGYWLGLAMHVKYADNFVIKFILVLLIQFENKLPNTLSEDEARVIVEMNCFDPQRDENIADLIGIKKDDSNVNFIRKFCNYFRVFEL